MKWNEEVIACVANVSLRFQSKEQGTGFSVLAARKMKERKRPRSRSIFRPAKTKIPVPRRSSVILLCSETTRKRLLLRLKKSGPQACKQAPWGRAPKGSARKLAQRSIRRIVVVSPGSKSIRPITNKIIQSGLSEMFFLIKLDSFAAIAKKRSSDLNHLSYLDYNIVHTSYWKTVHHKKPKSISGLHIHVPQRSQRLPRHVWYINMCEFFTLKSCWSTCAVTVLSRLLLFSAERMTNQPLTSGESTYIRGAKRPGTYQSH